ncbi:hypothetical protein ACNF33_13910, partial [Staphylococcus aureus]|uniref:hypothetical protein n=1 Tax=Staphylococcus aureus TaxID=1280 RepID=UPI003A80869D
RTQFAADDEMQKLFGFGFSGHESLQYGACLSLRSIGHKIRLRECRMRVCGGMKRKRSDSLGLAVAHALQRAQQRGRQARIAGHQHA